MRPVFPAGLRRHTKGQLFLAIVMGGIAAMLARSWLQSHARASLGDESIGTIVVGGTAARIWDHSDVR